MKLMHLADLHLGKRVNGFSMMEDQEYILNRILEIMEEEQPDGLLIAGDVYDGWTIFSPPWRRSTSRCS